jgi:hypothetical protein
VESIYYSITWACHRKCVHCYEDKFRPYVRDKLKAVVDETIAVFPRVVANLPERMTYLDLDRPKDGSGYHEGVGRIILSGGEVLIDPIREPALYPCSNSSTTSISGSAASMLRFRPLAISSPRKSSTSC